MKHTKTLADFSEEVEHPSHYTAGSIECIDAIKSALSNNEYIGYLKGQVMKYVWRMGLKGSVIVDAKKAEWYMDRLNEEIEQNR